MAGIPTRPLNDIRFEKTDGGLGRTTGKRDDAISALIFSGNEKVLKVLILDILDHPNNYGFDILKDGVSAATRLDNPDGLAGIGIIRTEPGEGSGHNGAFTEAEAEANALHYHTTEYFRLNEGAGPLYVGVCKEDTDIGEAIIAIQRYAGGSIRQIGVAMDDINDQATHITRACALLEDLHMPLCVVGTGVKLLESVPHQIANDVYDTIVELNDDSHSCNLSLLVGRDLDANLAAETTDENNVIACAVGCVGACIGAISKARVHESISWVGKFPLGLKEPGVGGTALRNITTEALENLNGCRAIFVRTHVGIADNYFNDSHTLAPETSDYAYIENVRTIDKACRGVRSKLLPYLNSPLSVDASTGKLSADTVAFLETKAGEAVEEMEKAGELCGYKVTIDPDQNVLATSEVEVVIQNVPKGVMRKVNVKIGFTTQV